MILTKEILPLYPNDFHRVKIHQNKATNPTSKNITAFLGKMKIDTSIEYIPFQYIPAKSPDVSPRTIVPLGFACSV